MSLNLEQTDSPVLSNLESWIRKLESEPEQLQIISSTGRLVNWTITARDVRCLLPSKCLNDAIVNCLLQLISSASHFGLRARAADQPTIHTWDSYLYENLIGLVDASDWIQKAGIRSLHDRQVHLLPIYREMHWALAKIDMRDRKICLFDSLWKAVIEQSIFSNLQKWINDSVTNDEICHWTKCQLKLTNTTVV
ncbi:hypothetical protein DL95DRAFT_529819 [Leptodontidium sp. 2 PMI_412]|nr:hypothetical protein DL95DRAFT_529819 [Leptodontidium sp. 2 PMI_412]